MISALHDFLSDFSCTAAADCPCYYSVSRCSTSLILFLSCFMGHVRVPKASPVTTQYRRGGDTPEEIAPIQSPQCRRTAGIRACTWGSAVVHTSNHIPPGLALAGPPWKRRHTHAANHDCTERARVKGPAVRLGTRPVLYVSEDSGRFLDSATSEMRVESKESKPRI